MRTLFGLGALLVLIVYSSAQADVESEREILAHLVHELDVLETLIEQAERAADPDARVRFRYDWLRQDLKRVRQGVDEHINARRTGPRTVKPLRGDYRR